MVQQTEVNGLTVITLVDGFKYLVQSRGEPNVWHECSRITCDCRGYQFCGHCRHVAAVREQVLRQDASQRDAEQNYFAELEAAKANEAVHEEVARNWRNRRLSNGRLAYGTEW